MIKCTQTASCTEVRLVFKTFIYSVAFIHIPLSKMQKDATKSKFIISKRKSKRDIQLFETNH